MLDVVVCVHNEEKYLEKCLNSIFNQVFKPHRVIVILDRCTDGSKEIAKKFPVEIIEKKECRWKYSYAENLQIGYETVKDDWCEYFAIVDADVVLPSDYFNYVLYRMERDKLTCASGRVVDKPKRMVNRLIASWKRFNLRFSPLGKRPRGCALVINRKLLDEIGGFADVSAPDTYVQNEALKRGYKIKLIDEIDVKHVRDEPLGKILKKQFQTGMARCELETSFLRTLLHGVFRLRPLVILGHAYAYYKKDKVNFVLWVVALILAAWFLWWYLFKYVPSVVEENGFELA